MAGLVVLGCVERMGGLIGRRHGMLVDRFNDIALLQAKRGERTAVRNAGDDDAFHVAVKMKLLAPLAIERGEVKPQSAAVLARSVLSVSVVAVGSSMA